MKNPLLKMFCARLDTNVPVGQKLSSRDAPQGTAGVSQKNWPYGKSISLDILSEYLIKMSEKVEGQRERIIWN